MTRQRPDSVAAQAASTTRGASATTRTPNTSAEAVTASHTKMPSAQAKVDVALPHPSCRILPSTVAPAATTGRLSP